MEKRMKQLFIVMLFMVLAVPLFSAQNGVWGAAYEYVGSVKSDIYHYPNCDHVASISEKNMIYFVSASEAVSQNYRPCKRCTPPLPGAEVSAIAVEPSQQPAIQTFVPATISVKVNSNAVNMTDSQPFVENGRTYVPVRAVLEAYGVDSVVWEPPYVVVMDEGVTLRIPVGQNYIEKNGAQLPIDAPALIREGRTCLPIRAIIEALGGTVSWDAGAQCVMITGGGSNP